MMVIHLNTETILNTVVSKRKKKKSTVSFFWLGNRKTYDDVTIRNEMTRKGM